MSLKRNRIKSVFSTVGILIKSIFDMKKRKLLASFLIVSSSLFMPFFEKVKAEEYLCSFSLNNLNQQGQTEVRKYLRIGDRFQVTSEYGKYMFSIAKETSKFMVLTLTSNAPNIMVTIIDKKSKATYENYLRIEDGGNPAYPTYGKCIVS